MPIARLTKYADLIAFLAENNIPHKPEPEKLAVEVVVSQPANAGTVFIRWESTLPLIQIVYPFIGDVPAARIPELETALCRVNTTIKLPGFGFEYGHNFVFMRLAVQLYEDGIPAATFQRQILAVLQNAREFAGAFKDIIAGAPGKDVLQLVAKHNQPIASGGAP